MRCSLLKSDDVSLAGTLDPYGTVIPDDKYNYCLRRIEILVEILHADVSS
jgi:hypothetical protein